MRLLLISNSTNAGEEYLSHPKENIKDFLGTEKVNCLFIPYAAVTFSFDDYEAKVKSSFLELGHDIVSIHKFDDPVKAIEQAEAIVVGGGNTWQLTRMMQEQGLLPAIKEKLNGDTPYIGWSAGSNVACPSIKTTNDMPITQPLDFNVLGMVPFQINPHYLDANPDGHAGETREMRIEEFLEANPGIRVVGLREGTMLLVEGKKMDLLGPKPARIFLKGEETYELEPGADLSFLL